MATLTIAIDPSILHAAEREAERRQISLDQMVADYLASVTSSKASDEYDNAAILRLLERGPLGDIGMPLKREEIYAERTWPRS